jgi:hypothetical protein
MPVSKYGRQHRAETHRATRDAYEQAATEVPWTPPAKEECEEDVFVTELDDTTRITMRRRTWNQQLVDFAVVLSVLDDTNAWAEMSCIDCCHGAVHRHRGPHDESDSEIILPIRSQADVQYSIDAAYDAIYAEYETLRGWEE